MLAEALGGGGRIQKFRRDGWDVADHGGVWNWENLWQECGSPGGPGYDS
jgi:hypothetical protein